MKKHSSALRWWRFDFFYALCAPLRRALSCLCGEQIQPSRSLLLRGLHLQRVIEPVEIVEQPDGCQQLNDLAFIKMPAQLAPELVVDRVSVAGDALRQAEGSLLLLREIGALL